MFKYLFLFFLTLGSAHALTPTQCSMLGDVGAEMTARLLKDEKPEVFLKELFPKLDGFPQNLGDIIRILPDVIATDFKVFPEYRNAEAHREAIETYCFQSAGNETLILNGFKDFIATHGK